MNSKENKEKIFLDLISMTLFKKYGLETKVHHYFGFMKKYFPEMTFEKCKNHFKDHEEKVKDYALMDEKSFEKLYEEVIKETDYKEPVRENGYPDLDQRFDSLRLRIAPNPNAPPTLANLRSVFIHLYYFKKGAKVFLRFDDTDPESKKPVKEGYEGYLRALKWAGFKDIEVIKASNRFNQYFSLLRILIEKGRAYCVGNYPDFKESLKNNEVDEKKYPIEWHLEKLDLAISGKLEDRSYIFRFNSFSETDLTYRDWCLARIRTKANHPLIKENLWPTLNLQSAYDDHDLNINYIFRGKDLISSGICQKQLYEAMNWEYPLERHWGRNKFLLEDGSLIKISSSLLAAPYDDLTKPTSEALLKLGLPPNFLETYFEELGFSDRDCNLDYSKLMKKIIDQGLFQKVEAQDRVEIEHKIHYLFLERETSLKDSKELSSLSGFVKTQKGYYFVDGSKIFLISKVS